MAKLLLNAGAAVEIHNSLLETPLHYAAQAGCKKIVRILLKKGAEVNTCDINGATPLHWAIEGGHSGIVELLLDAGAAVEAEHALLGSPLQLAKAQKEKKCAKLIRVHLSKRNTI